MVDKKKKVVRVKYKERLKKIKIYHFEVVKMELSDLVSKQTGLAKEEVFALLGKPPSLNMGDVAFPCFSLAKIQRKSPNIIATELAESLEELVERQHDSNQKANILRRFYELSKDYINYKMGALAGAIGEESFIISTAIMDFYQQQGALGNNFCIMFL